jgi:hypothetical protein
MLSNSNYRYFLSRLAGMCADAIDRAKIGCQLHVDEKGVRLSYGPELQGAITIVDWPASDPVLPFNDEEEGRDDRVPCLDPLVECQIFIKKQCMERWALRTNDMNGFQQLIAQLVSGLVFWRLSGAKSQGDQGDSECATGGVYDWSDMTGD